MTDDFDPQLTQFVTKVMDMTPEPPAYPGVVTATPEPRKSFPSWVLAPAAGIAVLLVVVPLALRSGGGGEIEATGSTSTTVAADAATNDAIDTVSPIPGVDADRNILSAVPSTAAPGSPIDVDFAGSGIARSELWWMDRFDYDAQQWFVEYLLWSDRSATGMRWAEASSVSVIVPEPTLVDDGSDRLTLPTGIPLGTYRVCIAVTDGPCALLEVTDAAVPNTAVPTNGSDLPVNVGPDFALVNAVPGDRTIIATHFQFLTGPDADLVAIADGFIAEGETLPNGFYLRPTFGRPDSELEPANGFVALVVEPQDASSVIELNFDEWVSWVLPQPGGGSGSASAAPMYAHLTFDDEGRVLTLSEQYIP